MISFRKYISLSLLFCYLLAGYGQVYPIVDYLSDRSRIISEECEMREQLVNDCQGFCVITSRYMAVSDNQPEQKEETAAVIKSSVSMHLASYETPSITPPFADHTRVYIKKSSVKQGYDSIPSPPPKV